MSLVIVTAEVPPQPWKNGGGVLRELLLRPDGDAWTLRIAVADIAADGPFSAFPGVERWFATIHGAGVELAVQARPGHAGSSAHRHRVTAASGPVRFDGDAPTQCRLIDGPTQALNLMLRGARGRLLPVVDAQAWTPDDPSAGLYSTVAGRCNGIALPPDSLLWFDEAPPRLAFSATAHSGSAPVAWWVTASMGTAR